MGDVIVIAIVAVILFFIIRSLVRKKGGCSCDCSQCGCGCGCSCGGVKKEEISDSEK